MGGFYSANLYLATFIGKASVCCNSL